VSKPGPKRPALVVGFAAETENLVANAVDKRKRKGCDWIVANDVSSASGTFGGERNTVHLITGDGVEVVISEGTPVTVSPGKELANLSPSGEKKLAAFDSIHLIRASRT